MLAIGKTKRLNAVYLSEREFEAIGGLLLEYGSPPVNNVGAWIFDRFAPWSWPPGEESAELGATNIENLMGLGCFLQGLLGIPDLNEKPVVESVLSKVEKMLIKGSEAH